MQYGKTIDELLASVKKPERAAEGEDFCFAAAYLDHGHIYSMVSGLAAAGGKLTAVYDRDPERARGLAEKYGAKVCREFDEIFEDRRIKLVATAAIPSERGPVGCAVMRRGLDYFTDKSPFTTLGQLAEAEKTVRETGRRYFVCYSERLCSESAILAGLILDAGLIGRVVNIIGTGPHRLNRASRPEWFFRRSGYGGILTDIGSHQAEQFLYYTHCDDVTVTRAAVGNFANPETPELDDFGEMNLLAANGATGYHRVDWYTPDGLGSWGDGRCFLAGTKGFIELRKYLELGRPGERGEHLYLATDEGEFRIDARGTVGTPYFADLIRDCLEGTERAMPQSHTFAAARVSMEAQRIAEELTGR